MFSGDFVGMHWPSSIEFKSLSKDAILLECNTFDNLLIHLKSKNNWLEILPLTPITYYVVPNRLFYLLEGTGRRIVQCQEWNIMKQALRASGIKKQASVYTPWYSLPCIGWKWHGLRYFQNPLRHQPPKTGAIFAGTDEEFKGNCPCGETEDSNFEMVTISSIFRIKGPAEVVVFKE